MIFFNEKAEQPEQTFVMFQDGAFCYAVCFSYKTWKHGEINSIDLQVIWYSWKKYQLYFWK